MSLMDAMTIKMDAQYKELQSRAKQPTPDLDDDDMPISHEEEAKFMQTFLKHLDTFKPNSQKFGKGEGTNAEGDQYSACSNTYLSQLCTSKDLASTYTRFRYHVFEIREESSEWGDDSFVVIESENMIVRYNFVSKTVSTMHNYVSSKLRIRPVPFIASLAGVVNVKIAEGDMSSMEAVWSN
uniref:Uncharacterized protein n=1 Tax=Tanacetum cinerariifolium TaxID=118510 RepID=A0A6L2NB37_TANCI|nr:hypothetical protein [Tanacetum cinerariifolium]